MNRWPDQCAHTWYAGVKWPVGFNYVPSTAVNSTEMWQAESFDQITIRRELSWAGGMGYNSVRVFLQYIVWEREREGFLQTFGRFLSIAQECGLSVLPILFDDCAFDSGKPPALGRQPEPVPGVHNSRWTPSPGFDRADDPALQPMLKAYVDAVVGAHRDDPRILAWDLYNEPGNTQRGVHCLPLLEGAFLWARMNRPVQPLTSGVWLHNGDCVHRAILELSDIVSFHSYTPIEESCRIIDELSRQNRPMLVTEWLHRPAGNTIHDHLPLFHAKKIGCYHWGLVAGKTQTNLHWSTMSGAPDPNPGVWQHDMLHPDGTPYDRAEMDLIRVWTDKAIP